MDELELLDWRRRVFALYDGVRAGVDPRDSWWKWRAGRDELFRDHPQSPLSAEARAVFGGLDCFDYDPELRVSAEVDPGDGSLCRIAGSGDEPTAFRRFGAARFRIAGNELSLSLYWLEAYGGGVFLPFGDTTNGVETYGAGRYLLDTVKGADLGEENGRLVLDFNFAYNPSCSYDARWVCPLTPPENRLAAAIRAGERHRR